MQKTTLTRADLGVVSNMLRYAIKALHQDATPLATSGKDGVAPFLHGAFVFEFVHQPKALQCADCAQEIAKAVNVETPVQGTGIVAHADDHGVATPLAAGLGFDGRQYVLIVGSWVCPINELGVHSCLSGCDIAMLTYAAKYMHKAAGVDVAAGDLI